MAHDNQRHPNKRNFRTYPAYAGISRATVTYAKSKSLPDTKSTLTHPISAHDTFPKSPL